MEKTVNRYLIEHNYKKINLKAVLFDMDGVLYDSMKFHSKSWHQVMTEEGINSTPEEFYLYEGRVGTSTIDILINRMYNRDATDEEKARIYKRKSELFTQYNNGETIPYAYDMLKKVQDYNLKPVLVTGSGQASLLDKLDHNFPNVFDKSNMVTAFDVKCGKPDPEPYIKGLVKAGNLDPNEAIVVENAPMGIQSAKAANIFTIAINTGPLDDSVLLDAGADLLFPSMESLYKSWGNIIKELK